MRKLVLVFLLCSALQGVCQSNPSSLFCEQLDRLQKVIYQEHVSPKPLDDSLSQGVQKLFLKKLNENYWFFLESDFDLFSQDEFSIDNYINQKNCSFLEKYIVTYKLRIQEAIAHLENLHSIPLDYSGIEIITFGDPNVRVIFKDLDDYQNYWKRKVTYDVLSSIAEQETPLNLLKKEFSSLEPTFKSNSIDNQVCLLQELLHQSGGIETFVKEAFLNAFASYQDPNTNFFSPNDKDNFDNSISSNQFTFGIYPDKNAKGEIEISYVAPGSAAYKNGGIEANDIIKELHSISSNHTLIPLCISIEDIYSFLNDSKNKTILFKIKKKDGTLKDIELTKGILKSPENLTRGYVVNPKKPIGYINIPSFYTDIESPNGLGLANDVAKELYRLQKENIEGLIIDLRFNGGGSIREANELCGMFIDEGPVSIYKGKNRELEVFNDKNKGAIFSKPMVLIMNVHSASAAEFFAATMQDYHRAIIVGAQSYGKSSSQMILPLDETENMGFCKVTTNQYYRITGASIQSEGITPDIVFPSFYDGMNMDEKNLDFAFINIPLDTMLSIKTTPIKNIDRIVSKSRERISKHTSFQTIKRAGRTMKDEYLDVERAFPLTLEPIYNDLKNYEAIWSELEQHFEQNKAHIIVGNTSSVRQIISFSSEEKEMNESILAGISEDIYVEEAYAIIQDLLSMNQINKKP